MEVWTLINKKTNEIVRCDVLSHDVEFGNLYYFTDCKYSPYWFVNTKEKAELAHVKWTHNQYANNFERPLTEKIDINDYEIVCFLSN